MMDGMDDLVQFLRARLDDSAAGAGQWHDLECDIHTHLAGGLVASVAASRMLAEVPGAVCDCGGPARVLERVRLSRNLLRRYEAARTSLERSRMPGVDMARMEGRVSGLETAVRNAGEEYADHDDYRPEWRP